MTGPPLVVLDGASLADLRDAAEALTAAGWLVVDAPDRGPAGLAVYRAVIRDEADAEKAVLAAAHGTGVLLAIGRAPEVVRDALLDDLGRIGPLARGEPMRSDRVELDPDGARLLELLADGLTLGAAAAELHLSRRTADRRLADARATLAAATTIEAVARWQQRNGPSHRGPGGPTASLSRPGD